MKCAKFSLIVVAAVVVVAVSGCKVSHTIKVKQSQPDQNQEVQIDSDGSLTPITLVFYGKEIKTVQPSPQGESSFTQVLY